jgi:cytochrome P450
MIINSMMLLLQNPDQLQKVMQDFTLIPWMLEESLRLESVIQWQERVATRDTEVGGVSIPAGTRLRLVYASANRDPAVFSDPERFDIERDRTRLKQHLGFGNGIHFCLGAPLARLEGEVAFEKLLTRLKNLRLTPNNDFEHMVSGTHARSLKHLYLAFDPVY